MLLFIEVSRQRLTPDEFAKVGPRLYATLAGDLMIPVVGWFLIKAINRRRKVA